MTELKPVGVFYQPSKNKRRCSDCGEEISCVNKTGKCVSCAARSHARKIGGWNKGMKRVDGHYKNPGEVTESED